MTQSRSEVSGGNNLVESLLKGGAITFFTQPNRVLLNRASLYSNPFTTIYSFRFRYIFKGLHINLARGTMSAGSQVYVKEVTESACQHLPAIWRPLPVLMATSLSGMVVALTVETAFIRKTIISNDTLTSGGAKPSLLRFTMALPPLYFGREMGYSIIMFYTKDMAPVPQAALIGLGTFFTGMTHKFISLEAVRDLAGKNEVLPDFGKDGVMKTVKNIANGNVYTHPSMSVLFKNPDNSVKKAANFLHASCGLNMFLFRGAYLLVAREVLERTRGLMASYANGDIELPSMSRRS